MGWRSPITIIIIMWRYHHRHTIFQVIVPKVNYTWKMVQNPKLFTPISIMYFLRIAVCGFWVFKLHIHGHSSTPYKCKILKPTPQSRSPYVSNYAYFYLQTFNKIPPSLCKLYTKRSGAVILMKAEFVFKSNSRKHNT